MSQVSFGRKLFIILLVALALGLGICLGWYGRGEYENYPVGVMPTAAMQMAVSETEEAGQTATPTPTAPATSTAAPTRPIPTSTPTATPTPEREEWEIECAVKLVGALVECMELVTRGSEEPGVARLYWVGRCLPYGTAITLWKQEEQDEGNFWRELSQGVEWRWAFDPTECTRETEVPSPNHIVLNTMAGPGTYRISVRAGGDGLLLKTFFWNAPEASAPTPEPTEEPTATPSGATVEETPEATFTMEPRVQSTTPLRGFAGSPTETLYDTPGDGAEWVGTIWYASPVYIWECGVALSYPEGTYLSLVSHEGDGQLMVGWIATASYTDRHPCSYYSAPGVGALVNYLVAAGYGDEETIRDLPGLKYDPYAGVNQDLD